MALIIYPSLDWNSYISLTDAEAIITDVIYDTTKWDSLYDAQKEILLRQASLKIRLSINDPEISEAPSDLELATVYLAEYSIGKNMTYNDNSNNLKRIKIDGAIEKEFFGKSSSSTAIPNIVSSLLSQYGYSCGTKIYRS